MLVWRIFFCDCVENDAHKRLFNLSLTGHSPAKKKGGSQKRSAGKGGGQKRGNIITLRESFETGNADDCIDSDEEEDGGYLPTLTYKLIRATQKPKSWDPKVTLNSNYFAFLCPLTCNPKQFARGHPQVYSEDDIKQFNAYFQKQLSFNFCTTCATRKKSASLRKARASQLRHVDLDIVPTTFSRDTTDRQELSCCVLEDVLACPVGCHVIICICADAHGNPTKESYSDQVTRISDSRKTHNINTESWRMARDQYFMMQRTIQQATLQDKLQSSNLS